MLKLLCLLFLSTAAWQNRPRAGYSKLNNFLGHRNKNHTTERQSLDCAMKIQDDESPRIRYINEYVEVATAAAPARLLNGDFCHLCPRQDGISLFLGDVSGKGLPAALYRSRCLAVLENALARGVSFQETMLETHRHLVRRRLEDRFVTLAGVHLNPEKRYLSYVCAGHPIPVLVRRGRARFLSAECGDPPIGISEEWSCTINTFALQKEDLIILYSDGLSEARDSRRRFLGEEKLLSWCEALAGCKPDQVAESLLSRTLNYSGSELSDDTSIAVLRIR